MRHAWVVVAVGLGAAACEAPRIDPCPGMLTCPNMRCCPLGYPYNCNGMCFASPQGCAMGSVTCSDEPVETCGFDVVIETATCRFFDNPDPFASDAWFIDLTGSVTGGLNTELSINSTQFAVTINTQCAGWPSSASHACISQAGGPETATWQSTVEILSDRVPLTTTIAARARGVLSAPCQGELETTRTVTCN